MFWKSNLGTLLEKIGSKGATSSSWSQRAAKLSKGTTGLRLSGVEWGSQSPCLSAAGKGLWSIIVLAARQKILLGSTHGTTGKRILTILALLLSRYSKICGLEYFVEEVGDVEEDLVDAFWGNDSYDSRKHTWTQRSLDANGLERSNFPTSAEATIQPDLPQAVDDGINSKRWEKEELFFRRMYIVWQPIFVHVRRSIICRCILDQSSRSKAAPRIDFLVRHPCPTHSPARMKDWLANSAANWPRHVYTKSEEAGEYFEQYGGYDVFRLWVCRVLEENQDWCRFIDLRSLMPIDEFEQKVHLLENIDESVWDKLLEYEEETKRELERLMEDINKLTSRNSIITS